MFGHNEIAVRLSDRKFYTVIGTPADTKLVNTDEPAYLLRDPYGDHLVVSKSNMEGGRYENRTRKLARGLGTALVHVDDSAYQPASL